MKPWLALLLLVVALAARLQFLSGWASNFDSDEALVALTTRDLLHGRFHIFLPGQNYMGAIERITAAPFVALSHHPGAVRMAPLLWTVLGAFVFARLVSRGARPRGGGFSGPTGRDSLSGPIEPDAPAGRLGWNALVVWCLPPAVLFLAGVKARGGNMDALVLGLASTLLAWPRPPETTGDPKSSGRVVAGDPKSSGCVAAGDPESRPSARGPKLNRRAAAARGLVAGALCALAIWSQTSSVLFLPAIAVLLWKNREERALLAAACLLGLLIGYIPLWLPLLAAAHLPPPGIQGADVAVRPQALLSPATLSRMPRILLASVFAGGSPRLPAAILLALWTLAGWGACAHRISLLARRRMSDPVLWLLVWLAASTAGALLLMPAYFEDETWFRYTLGMTPLLLYGQLHLLSLLPRRIRAAGWIVLAGLALLSYGSMARGWRYPPAPRRMELAGWLLHHGATRIRTDWNLACPLQLFSSGAVMAACETPPRFPQINAAVDLAPAAWEVTARPLAAGEDGDLARASIDVLFRIEPATDRPPPAITEAFRRLDPDRTLFAHYEPFPLLAAGGFRRNPVGWPYRRPLSRFRFIVWQPGLAWQGHVPAATVQRALEALASGGSFTTLARSPEVWILGRPGAASLP